MATWKPLRPLFGVLVVAEVLVVLGAVTLRNPKFDWWSVFLVIWAALNYTGYTAWGAVEKAEESTQFVFFSFPNRFALAIPKHCVGADQLTQLRSLIRSKLGAQARLD